MDATNIGAIKSVSAMMSVILINLKIYKNKKIYININIAKPCDGYSDYTKKC